MRFKKYFHIFKFINKIIYVKTETKVMLSSWESNYDVGKLSMAALWLAMKTVINSQNLQNSAHQKRVAFDTNSVYHITTRFKTCQSLRASMLNHKICFKE